jgi:NAD(P)-dependent dehydrogenase (short-subunit alcohol dehydrogenase family)
MKGTLFDLTGRAALVTGGSKGLGKAMTLALAQAGADLFIASRHEDELKAAADEIHLATGARIEYAVADMSCRADVRRLADAAVAKLGKVDILVNNAGFNQAQKIDEIRDEDWDRMMEVNLTSCMALTRALVPGMKERRWGRIIHLSSMMALGSVAGRDAYSATKAALVGMTRAMAIDLGLFNITANCIAPGPIATDMPMAMLTPEQRTMVAGRTALGRFGQPPELAGPVLLLASEAGSYITGSVLIVDGGTLAKVF